MTTKMSQMRISPPEEKNHPRVVQGSKKTNRDTINRGIRIGTRIILLQISEESIHQIILEKRTTTAGNMPETETILLIHQGIP